MTSPKVGKIWELRKTPKLKFMIFHGDSEFATKKKQEISGKVKKHKNTHTPNKNNYLFIAQYTP